MQLWNKSIWKDTYYIIPIIWHSVKGKTMERVKHSVITRSYKEGRINRWNTGFLEQWNYTVWHYMMCVCVCAISLLKPIECKIPRENPNASCALRVIMRYQYRFIICNRDTSLVWDVDNEEHLWKMQGTDGNSLYILLNFLMKLLIKLLKK